MTRVARRSLVPLALLAAALPGCGGFGSDGVTEQVQGPMVVTNRQVDRYPPGSPARAFLEWWRAAQFDNPPVAARYYSSSLHLTTAKVDRMLALGTDLLGLAKRPRLVEVDRHGNRATVWVLLETSTKNPNGRIDTTQTPRGFNLVRENGRWKLAENLYLARGIRVKEAFDKAAAKVQQPKR